MATINVKGIKWFTGYGESGRGTNDMPEIAEAIWKSRNIKVNGMGYKVAWPDIVGLNLRADRFFRGGHELHYHCWNDMGNGLDVQLQTPRADFPGFIIVRKHISVA
jgi:hypothetical protein